MRKDTEPPYLESIPHITKDLPYSAHTCQYGTSPEEVIYLHWHPEAEFLYLVQGSLSVMAEQEEVILNQGDAVFIPPNRLHRARNRSQSPGSYQAFVLSPTLIASPLERPQFQKYVQPILEYPVPCCHFTPKLDWQRDVIKYLKQLLLLAQRGEGDADWGLAVTGAAMVIWQLLYHYHIRQFRRDQARQRLAAQMEEALSFIHQNYEEEIRLPELADLAHLSESQFCRSFKRLTGMTPFAYLNRCRIMQGCLLLAKTDKKISEIGTRCGFNTVSYFNREFLKIIRMTPSAYRRLAREETGHMSNERGQTGLGWSGIGGDGHVVS